MAAGDLRTLLIEWFPRKVTVDRGEWPNVLSTLHCWIDFLAAASAGQPTDPAALHAAVEQNADAFAAAMADETNYGMAKFWMTRMIEHGVDLDDGEGVRRFLAAAQAGEIDYDQDALAGIMRRQAFDGDLGFVALRPDEGERVRYHRLSYLLNMNSRSWRGNLLWSPGSAC